MDTADRLPRPLTVRAPSLRGRTLPWGALLLALVAYVPLLLTRPGKVGADTKTYLYLDPAPPAVPGRLPVGPHVGLGTVTHQNIGYLWPMGPYYWLMDAIGVPDWVAQRLWLGLDHPGRRPGRPLPAARSCAGTRSGVTRGVVRLRPQPLPAALRRPHLGDPAALRRPPLADRPCRPGAAVRADGGAPAAFALVTLTVGGVNATSLLLVMVGARAVDGCTPPSSSGRSACAAGAGRRCCASACSPLVTSLWWIAGLLVQGRYGIPILRYTETYQVVADAALAPEVLRGLGYWFFYGTDTLGAWIQPAVTYIQSAPGAGAVATPCPSWPSPPALLTRFRHRLLLRRSSP